MLQPYVFRAGAAGAADLEAGGRDALLRGAQPVVKRTFQGLLAPLRHGLHMWCTAI